jgi:HEAT repeat protein
MKKINNPEANINPGNLPGNLVELINGLTDDKNFIKKHNARKTLVKMGKKITPQMHGLLNSGDGLLRLEAAKIVQMVADKRSIPVLINLLEDSEFDIRWIAAEGLIRIGRHSITPLLMAIRDGKSSLVLDKRAHQVLNSLLYEDEKEQLMSLMLSLDDYHALGETAPVEAAKALKTFKKFRN